MVVTTERSEHVLASKRGGRVRWEEVGELAETGRSRNAHRVAEASVSNRMETMEKVGKRNADTTQRQAGLIICGRRVHGVCVVASVAVAASFKRGFAS